MSPEIIVSIEKEESMHINERVDLIQASSLESHSSLMNQTRANSQHSHNLGRHMALKKFDEEDALEAAATEVVLTIANS